MVIKAEDGPAKCVSCWGIVASRASKSLAFVTSVLAWEMVKQKFGRSQTSSTCSDPLALFGALGGT